MQTYCIIEIRMFSGYETIMFTSAFQLAFFGFLRVGEFTSTSKKGGNIRALQISDVKLESSNSILRVLIRQSENDQRGRGFVLLIGPSKDKTVCPIAAYQKFIKIRPNVQEPQFLIHYNGAPLSRYQFSAILRKTLTFCDIKVGCYRSHSFRIGAASEAFNRGIPEETIKLWGRWRSSIRIISGFPHQVNNQCINRIKFSSVRYFCVI